MTGSLYEFAAMAAAGTSAVLAQRAALGEPDEGDVTRAMVAVAACLLVAGFGFLILSRAG